MHINIWLLSCRLYSPQHVFINPIDAKNINVTSMVTLGPEQVIGLATSICWAYIILKSHFPKQPPRIKKKNAEIHLDVFFFTATQYRHAIPAPGEWTSGRQQLPSMQFSGRVLLPGCQRMYYRNYRHSRCSKTNITTPLVGFPEGFR